MIIVINKLRDKKNYEGVYLKPFTLYKYFWFNFYLYYLIAAKCGRKNYLSYGPLGNDCSWICREYVWCKFSEELNCFKAASCRGRNSLVMVRNFLEIFSEEEILYVRHILSAVVCNTAIIPCAEQQAFKAPVIHIFFLNFKIFKSLWYLKPLFILAEKGINGALSSLRQFLASESP